jgi:hypothetical protein
MCREDGGMKRSLIVILIALLVVAVSGIASAEEQEGGVEVEAGVKAWYNSWKNQDPDPAEGTKKFDAALLVGPAVEVKLPQHFYVEGSYLISTNDYEYSYFGLNLTSDRKDLDLAAGYRIIPELAVFIGYKDSKMDWDFAGLTSGSFDLRGPFVGVRGDVPVNVTISIYASALYQKTKLESTAVGELTTNHDSPGTVFELGVRAAFNKELSGTLGYKIESTKEDVTNVKDTFDGLTLGVMYAF